MSYSEMNENEQQASDGNETERRQNPVVAPEFPQQLQVPMPSGASIPSTAPGSIPYTGVKPQSGMHAHGTAIPFTGVPYPDEVYGVQSPQTGTYPYGGMKQSQMAGTMPAATQHAFSGQMSYPGQMMWSGQPTTGVMPAQVGPQGVLPLEQSYIENILRFNLGKRAKFYQTFEYNPEWPAKVFHGILDEAGRDHIIVRNPETGKSYLLLMVNLDYVEFDEPISYISPALPGYVTAQPTREQNEDL